jgi:TolB-like protein/tetratricopeptide (TPR) repeat protein
LEQTPPSKTILNPRNFFAELKRRNVYKVAVAYAVVGWLLMQVAATVVPALHLPDGITTAVVVVTLLGFPIALVIAWAFEMTPEGMKRTENVSPDEVIPQWSARKFAAMIVSVALLAAALLVFQIVRSKSTSPAQPSPESTTTADGESIAVLPFVNMSSDKEQDYFSDGLSEELLNQLAQIPQLRVIARTSSFSFKGKEVDVATIARALNVANVLEGSVRKSGDTLRITAQLVRASDSSHLWSQTYDRQMTDIFKVQDEIAGDVVAALKVKLLPTQQLPKTQRTSNSEAYEHYLLGMDILRQDRMQTSHLAAAEFEKTIALDPNYANAYVALSNAQALAAEVASSPAQRAEGIKQALATAEEAITLAPDLASGYSSRGYLRYSRAWDWRGAAADFKRALALDPNNAALLSSYSQSLFFSGHQTEAIAMARKSAAIDPLSVETWRVLGLLLFCSGQDVEARLAWQHALEINPGTRWPNYLLGYLDLKQGNIERALAHFHAADEAFRLTGTAMVEYTLGHADESDQALDTLKTKYATGSAFQIAAVYAWRGEKDQAFEWLDRAYDQHDTGMPRLRYDPTLASLHDDPRFAALVKKMGLSE